MPMESVGVLILSFSRITVSAADNLLSRLGWDLCKSSLREMKTFSERLMRTFLLNNALSCSEASNWKVLTIVESIPLKE